jgi:anti-sigma regulatory factor (Ser/Thr protein kinase)
MPFYACPNCGSSVSSAASPAPGACPSCCARLHLVDGGSPTAVADRPEPRPKPALRVPLDSGSDSPAAARRALHELRDELGEARFRVCELLVSELVTNVVLHTPGDSPFAAADMRVRFYGDRVRVEVRDDGPGFAPKPRTNGQNPNSGWGLHLVDELADHWGVERGVQNCVWFEVGRTPLASGLHAAAHN